MPNHTIAENLQRLQTARTNIASAIVERGGTVNSGDGFEEFPADILSIPNATIYGWHINPNESDSYDAVSYIEDAVGMTPAYMGSTAFNYGSWGKVFFIPKPCMVRYDGTVDYYLDPNDYTKKADGTPSDIGNPAYQGNAMMEWGLLWFKFWSGNEEGEGYFCVADRKVDDTYDCTCNYDADGNITEHFYTAIYQGTTAPNYDNTKTYAVDDIVTYSDAEYKCITAIETAEAFDSTKWTQLSATTRLRSLSGVRLISANGNGYTTGTQEVARATACNTTAKTEWYIETWCDRVLINALLVLMGKSLDTQGTFGRGIDSGSRAQKEAYVTGALNDKGLFYGSTANGTTAVKTFGMENWWALAWHRTAGLVGGANNTYLYKMTWSTHDGSTATGYNSNGSGYLSTSGRPATNYLYKAKYDKWGFLPIVTGSSNALYYKDYFSTGEGFALCGGTSNRGATDGTFCVNLPLAFSTPNWHIAAAPSFKPLVGRGE